MVFRKTQPQLAEIIVELPDFLHRYCPKQMQKKTIQSGLDVFRTSNDQKVIKTAKKTSLFVFNYIFVL